jgi:hypothetical protein
MVIAAAGALSVATAASATAATWSQESQGHADGPAEITHDTADAPRLAVTYQLAGPIAEAATGQATTVQATTAQATTVQAAGQAAGQAARQSNATWAQHAYLVRLIATQRAIAQRKASRKAAAASSPRQIAQAMLGSFGWSAGQFSCLDPLWAHESGWSVTAENAGSGAYGIPQALPGSRMASAGANWQTSAATQIKWGLDYIKGTYGSPCGAWAHEGATGWY